MGKKVWQSARKNSTRSTPKPKWKLKLNMQLYFSFLFCIFNYFIGLSKKYNFFFFFFSFLIIRIFWGRENPYLRLSLYVIIRVKYKIHFPN